MGYQGVGAPFYSPVELDKNPNEQKRSDIAPSTSRHSEHSLATAAPSPFRPAFWKVAADQTFEGGTTWLSTSSKVQQYLPRRVQRRRSWSSYTTDTLREGHSTLMHC